MTKASYCGVAVLTASLCGGLFGCEDKSEGAPPNPAARGSAIDQITNALCAREQTCENIGAGKKYDSINTCLAEISRHWKADLDKRACSNGIVETELTECVREIRQADCQNPFDTLERTASCRESDICQSAES